MALRLGKLPPGEGISPAEELIYVLGEIIRLEAEWRTSRDIYLNRHDFEQQEIAKFVGEKRELNDDDLFRIFKQFGVHPSTQEISLFLKRFGNGTSVKAYDLLNLLIPQDYKPSFRNISERVSKC
jgi:hypothetical protein